jgi:hypothetical protein
MRGGARERPGWVGTTQQALTSVAARGPTPATIIDVAIVHLAMRDAVQS